jgi:hypothetical protein
MKWVSMRWKDRMYEIDFGELLASIRSTKAAFCLVTFSCYTLSFNQTVSANQCVNQLASRNTIFRQALCAVAYWNTITAYIHSFRRQAHVATIQCHKTADVDATGESWKDCKKVITRYELCALCTQTIRFAFCREVLRSIFNKCAWIISKCSDNSELLLQRTADTINWHVTYLSRPLLDKGHVVKYSQAKRRGTSNFNIQFIPATRI